MAKRFSLDKEKMRTAAQLFGGLAVLVGCAAFAIFFATSPNSPFSTISHNSQVAALGCTDSATGCKVVVLTTLGNGTWTVPADLDPEKQLSIQVIGGGGGGMQTQSGANGDPGGGGGAYAKIEDLALTPGQSIKYRIGAGGGERVDGGDTWFNYTPSGYPTSCTSGMSICAKGGQAPDDYLYGGTGGTASASIGTVKYSGGKGGDRGGSSADPGSGGGGAGGPGGNGKNGYKGENEESDGAPGAGGPGGNGLGGAGGGGVGDPIISTVGAGSDGHEINTPDDYTLQPGSGGGGSGAWDNSNGYRGGDYGGGGGGAGDDGDTGGSGAPGVIVIMYNLSDASSPTATIVATATGTSSATTGEITVPYGTAVRLDATYAPGLTGTTVQKKYYLTSTITSSFTVPDTWVDGVATIHAIGAGGGGNNEAEGGGGGGAFASSSVILSPGMPIRYVVGRGGEGAYDNEDHDNGLSGEDTCFSIGTTACSWSNAVVYADAGKGGASLPGGAGGSVSGSIGTVRYAGGAGGSGPSSENDGGGGGGGAAGPGGAGKNGGNGASDGGGGGGGAGGGLSTAGGNASGDTGGNGGNGPLGASGSPGGGRGVAGDGGDPGVAGGGGGGGTDLDDIAEQAGAGGHGTEWDATHGAGGGGGGGSVNNDGGAAGRYGGGGGAAASIGGHDGADGANGIITIIYNEMAIDDLTGTAINDDATGESIPWQLASYWGDRNSSYTTSAEEEKSFLFPSLASNPSETYTLKAGVHTFSAQIQTLTLTTWDSYASVQVTVTCPTGYAGDTCNVCADDYQMSGSVCTPCPSGSSGAACAVCDEGYGMEGGACTECTASEHSASNLCQDNEAACNIPPGGYGTMTWDPNLGDEGEFGPCIGPTSCASGYEMQEGACVAIANPAIDTLMPDVTRVRSGQDVTLTWSGTDLPVGVGVCTITSAPPVPGWNGALVDSTATGGFQAGVGPITGTTEFTITCSTATAQTTVGIVPSFREI